MAKETQTTVTKKTTESGSEKDERIDVSTKTTVTPDYDRENDQPGNKGVTKTTTTETTVEKD